MKRGSAEEEEDPHEARIRRTGCAELNEKVQQCFAETKDWSKCQTEVHAFKECFEKYQSRVDAIREARMKGQTRSSAT